MDDILTEEFQIDIQRFPSIPVHVDNDILEALVLQIQDLPLNSQRNFFSYLMIESHTLYERFFKIWELKDAKELEIIVPSC